MKIELTKDEMVSLLTLLGRMSRKETMEILKNEESSKDIDVVYEKLKDTIKG